MKVTLPTGTTWLFMTKCSVIVCEVGFFGFVPLFGISGPKCGSRARRERLTRKQARAEMHSSAAIRFPVDAPRIQTFSGHEVRLPSYSSTAILRGAWLATSRKTLLWIGSSLRDMRQLPADVQDVFGRAILDAQYGDHPVGARPFGERLSREIMKLSDDHDGETYRAAYTVFPEAVYVLHVFHKKSTRGAGTPKADKRRIGLRWKSALEHYSRSYPPSR